MASLMMKPSHDGVVRLGDKVTALKRTAPMPEPAKRPSPSDRDWMLDLSSQLQTTLQIDKLIQLFSEHLQTLVRHDSATFNHDAQELLVTLGTPQQFSCTYDVVLLDDYLGTVTLTRNDRFSEREMNLVEYALIGLVHPMRNAFLYREALRVASHDPLTGVNNRSNLDKVLDRELELAKRHNSPLSIIMVDIDRFKSINDTYGHVVGDYALKALADCMVSCARDSDIVFRYGGEEFIIVLSTTDTAGAGVIAERLRKSVEMLKIRFDDNELKITISLGVSTYHRGDTRVSLLANADRALYESKRGGRNRVTSSA